jgi:hypothetical protein
VEQLLPDRIRPLLALLTAGTPTGASVALAVASDAETDVRCVGDPGVSVASNGILPMQVDSFRSESPTSHRLQRSSVLSLSGRIGTEQTQLFEESSNLSELVGTTRIDGPSLSCSQVLALLREKDSVLRLNGRLLFPSDGLTEQDLERFARRYLDGEADPKERVNNHRLD